MFTKNNLIFPLPEEWRFPPDYLENVQNQEVSFMRNLKGENDPVKEAHAMYIRLIKNKGALVQIEGMAQIIRKLEGLSIEEQEDYIRKAPVFYDGQVVQPGTLQIGTQILTANTPHWSSKPLEISVVQDWRDGKMSFLALNTGEKQLLISNKNVLQGVSWNELNEQGLISGKPIVMNGQGYLLRTPSGLNENGPSEWDLMLSKIGTSNNIWHWDARYSWCQESANSTKAIIRKNKALDMACYCDKDSKTPGVCWRIVLELL